VSTRPLRPKMPPRKAASGAVGSLNGENTSSFSCLALTTSAISRKRASLREIAGLGPGAVAQPLRGVVADLLEAHPAGRSLIADSVGNKGYLARRFPDFTGESAITSPGSTTKHRNADISFALYPIQFSLQCLDLLLPWPHHIRGLLKLSALKAPSLCHR
jgi:hypothetical protein